MDQIARGPAGLARVASAGFIVMVMAIVWAHGLAAVLGRPDPSGDSQVNALALTAAAAIVGAFAIIGGLRVTPTSAAALGGLGGGVGMLVLAIAGLVHWTAGSSLLLVGVASGAMHRALSFRLPQEMENLAVGRKRWAAAWIVFALLSVLQMGRLATYVTDSEFDWVLGTRHEFWYKHACLPAYIYGAELNERGDPNIYKAEHYLALSRDAKPETRFDMVPADPYQYPPPFLLLPRLAIWLSDDYQSIYAVWFAIQATGFIAMSVALALWVGGRTGAIAILLIPCSLLAFPTLYTLQFGQFHLTMLVLAVGAMVLFKKGRNRLGGGLLGFAILAKVFPGILLVWLAVRQRWAPLAWTVTACALFSIAGLLLLGIEPFETFVTYQLPRLSSGEAFAFDTDYPELEDFVVSANQSYLGVVQKLGILGVPGMTDTFAGIVGKLFSLAVLAVTFFAARRRWECRHDQAAAWLSLLGLASLVGAGGWVEHTPIPALWLLTFMTSIMMRSRMALATLGVFWLFLFFMIGSMPIGSWFSPPVMAPLSLVASASLHAFFILVLLGTVLRMEPFKGAGEPAV